MGLCRYDGKTFTDFSDKQSKDVRRIFEDRAGNLWFGTNGDGVYRYDPSAAHGASRSLSYYSTQEGLSGMDVRCIAEDKKGNLWFGTDAGVSEFDGKHFANFTMKESKTDNDTWSILIDRKGTVWVATTGGVFRCNASAGGSKTFTPFPILAAVERDFSRWPAGTKLIWDIKEDRAGNIWFATNGRGVYRYDGKKLSNISQKDGLCSNFVNSILEDRKGNLWFATQHEGVSRYDPSAASGIGKPFTNFTYKDGLCSKEVWTMTQDKTGNIWLSARGSLCRYDGRSFKDFTSLEGLQPRAFVQSVRNYVQNIFEDRKGTLWLGCSGGLYRFDGTSITNVTKEWTLGML